MNNATTMLTEWAYVDADNDFEFAGLKFTIPKNNKDYLVYNKYSDVEYYTNESAMDSVLVNVNENAEFKFYNQNIQEITGIKLKLNEKGENK